MRISKIIIPIAVWSIVIGIIFWVKYNQTGSMEEALKVTGIVIGWVFGFMMVILTGVLIYNVVLWKKKK